jgi:hypothetical protein
LHLQLSNVPLASGEYEFAGHAVHAEVDEEYFPASQFTQFPAPVEALYFPATHSVHAAPFTPDAPALQKQLFKVPLPAAEYEFEGHPPHVSVAAPTAVEYLPASQFAQSPAPVEVLYFPATHSVHAAPFTPDAPALQKQLFKVPLPAAEYVFSGQDEQDGIL